MIVKESCRYVRSYSELEGLQRAHTLCYSARRTETGIVLELALEEGGVRSAHRALCARLTGRCAPRKISHGPCG